MNVMAPILEGDLAAGRKYRIEITYDKPGDNGGTIEVTKYTSRRGDAIKLARRASTLPGAFITIWDQDRENKPGKCWVDF